MLVALLKALERASGDEEGTTPLYALIRDVYVGLAHTSYPQNVFLSLPNLNRQTLENFHSKITTQEKSKQLQSFQKLLRSLLRATNRRKTILDLPGSKFMEVSSDKLSWSDSTPSFHLESIFK